jgi:hypothetical protein
MSAPHIKSRHPELQFLSEKGVRPMITVNIWNYRGSDVAWGHASLQISDGNPGGDIYISYWPQGANRQPSSVSDRLYCVQAIPDRSFQDDVDAEGQDGDGKLPDHVVHIDGLNEGAMRQFWTDILGDANAQWCTLRNNCSTTVANVLYQGGGDDFAGDWWASHNIVWTPNNVLSYALAILGGIAESQQGPSDGDGGLPPGGTQ